jgi:hypothetical protein
MINIVSFIFFVNADVFINLTYLEHLDFSFNPTLMQLDGGHPPLRLVRE